MSGVDSSDTSSFERARARFEALAPSVRGALEQAPQPLVAEFQGRLLFFNAFAASLLGAPSLGDALTTLLTQANLSVSPALSSLDLEGVTLWVLRDLSSSLAGLLEGLNDALVLVDQTGEVLTCNSQAAAMLGLPQATLTGAFSRFIDDPARRSAFDAALADARAHTFRLAPGVTLSMSPLQLERRALSLLTLRPDDSRAANDTHYRTLFESTTEGIFVSDSQGHYLDVNPAGCAMLGYTRDELLRLQLSDLVSAEELEVAPLQTSTIVVGQRTVRQRSLKRKDGTLLPVEISANRLPNGDLQGVVRDLSERRQQEDAIRQATKLDAVGRLAGGVAHDFNNILTVMLSLTHALNAHVDAEGRSLVAELEQTAGRAAELTKQLLAFARRQPANPKVIDLNEHIRTFSRFLSRTLGEDVRLALNLCAGPLFARLDPVHFEQILLNLAVNAREAMPTGGSLTVTTRAEPAGQATIAIADSGTGMTAATMQRLFEPFFTTKDRGRGTGLGLATVYGIVKQNGGNLAVTSALGQGSTFTLTFAVADPSHEATVRSATPIPSRQGLVILVVEDDLAVRETIERSLKADGHQVYAVASLAPAVQIASLHPDLDLLITDVVMPEAGGKEVALAVQRLRPRLPVLFVSGYAPDTQAIASLGDLLSKPFTQSSLRAAVAAAMRRRSL